MPLFPSLQLLSKLANLRDEAARAIAVLPQINAALAEPLVYRKLELFAPISSEVFLILASGIKDLDPELTFGSAGESDEEQYDVMRAECAAMGINLDGLKEFLVKVKQLAKQIYDEIGPYLPYIVPFII